MKVNYTVTHELFSELDIIKKKATRKEGLAVHDELVLINSKYIYPKEQRNKAPIIAKKAEVALATFIYRYPLYQSTKGWTYT